MSRDSCQALAQLASRRRFIDSSLLLPAPSQFSRTSDLAALVGLMQRFCITAKPSQLCPSLVAACFISCYLCESCNMSRRTGAFAQAALLPSLLEFNGCVFQATADPAHFPHLMHPAASDPRGHTSHAGWVFVLRRLVECPGPAHISGLLK